MLAQAGEQIIRETTTGLDHPLQTFECNLALNVVGTRMINYLPSSRSIASAMRSPVFPSHLSGIVPHFH